MAFMVPVVRNDYQIYKSNKSRRVSECSNNSGPGSCPRSRKISEFSKSEGPSLSASPGTDFSSSPAHRSAPLSIASRHHSNSFSYHQTNGAHSNAAHFASMKAHHSHPHLQSKTSSRTSQSSLPLSPSKSDSLSPPKPNSTPSSLSLFHNKLVDKLKKSLKSKDSVSNGSRPTVAEAARRRS